MAYLNEQVKEPREHTFTYQDIAEATYLSKETVKEILLHFDSVHMPDVSGWERSGRYCACRPSPCC
ncbi:MAG: hypothetical protein H6822_20395 [Planctomycetaceae bacterium]|nr:hypothetical protein [Planctomycetales bacterium]MCB9924550.1 hypothetical protein [Planctomycetaceae bacterium]